MLLDLNHISSYMNFYTWASLLVHKILCKTRPFSRKLIDIDKCILKLKIKQIKGPEERKERDGNTISALSRWKE